MRTFVLTALVTLIPLQSASAEISRIWLTHRTTDPSKIVVNWETAEPGNSVVRYGLNSEHAETVAIDENVTLHHVEIPIPERDTTYHYVVSTGDQTSPDATFKAYPTDVLRVAVVADWQGKPDLPGLLNDDVHLLLTAGDNVSSVYQRCGSGNKDCIEPYADLIDRYPALFRSTPFMPVIGNHDTPITQGS